MTPQPGKQVIAIHILTNVSGSKGNQAIKFGQLIHKMWWRNYSHCEKSKLSISLNQYSKVLYFLFLLFCKLRAIEID